MATLDGKATDVLNFVGGSKLAENTVVVDGLTLTAVSGYANLYTDTAKNFYVYDAEGLKSLNNWFEANKFAHAIWGKTFNIMADIDAAGMTWNSVYLQTPNNDCVGFTLNGNNSTISNLTISGSGMFSGYRYGRLHGR